MTVIQRKLARRSAATEYQAVSDYCAAENMRLSRDKTDGYWLHFDGKMRFVRFLSDVRGLVDYLNTLH